MHTHTHTHVDMYRVNPSPLTEQFGQELFERRRKAASLQRFAESPSPTEAKRAARRLLTGVRVRVHG